jgi:hypothetical protein
MQKALYFLLAVLVLVILVYAKPVEGFESMMGMKLTEKNAGTPESLYTKLPIQQPKVVSLAEAGVGNIQPSPPEPGTLPSAPVEQRSKETPNPYRDPTLQPAKYIRILSVKEDLQAFFGFQAPMLEDRNDPSIQIPLTRARADMAELIDVASVLERNPGLQSRITEKQLDDIQANLRYLREVLHDLEASGAIQQTAIEGFRGGVPATEVNTYKGSGPRASLKQLQEFQIKVVVEIQRLNASGTTDPVIQARINTLNRIKDDVDQVIAQLQNGSITADTVPIYSEDIERALPVLGKPSAPLPSVVRNLGLPSAISSLFPGGLSPKDTEQALQINNIVKGYMNNLVEGVSWGVNLNVKYDNPNIAKLKGGSAEGDSVSEEGKYPLSTGLPGVVGTAQIVGADLKDKAITPALKTVDRGYELGLPGTSISRELPQPIVGKLDWKVRSGQIKEQIRRRGLDPLNFGAIPDDAVVSSDFSWRGYAQMMCMRLNTTMDPGLAVSVGCPAPEWSGWRD